jgi:hypothetical protein
MSRSLPSGEHSRDPLAHAGYKSSPDAIRREIADPHSIVIARLDRASQYSRDSSD